MRRYKNASREELPASDSGAFNLSVSDLMAGLLSIFILALCVFILNLTQVQNQYEGNTQKRSEILQEIKTKLEEQNITVQINESQDGIHIPASDMFDVGEADPTEHGQEVIAILSGVISDILQNDSYKGTVETIFIEGHTDVDPIPPGTSIFASNWELSAQRAINTWKQMQEDDPELAEARNPQNQPIFSCSGYAESRPIDDSTKYTEEGKQANRRIDIRFAMVPPKASTAKINEK